MTLPESQPIGGLVAAALVRADQHPAAVYLARLASGSRRTMRGALDTIAGLVANGHRDALALNWGALRYPHTQAIRALLAERYAPATANKLLAALRGCLQEAWRLGLMTAEEYHRAADVRVIRGSPPTRGRALSPDELRRLLAVCGRDRTSSGTRDAAMLAVLYGGGLRRSELVALDAGDFDVDTAALTVRQGKGRKARTVYVPVGFVDILDRWNQQRGLDPGPWFCAIHRSGRLKLRRLTPQAVQFILQRRALVAGVSAFSPHDLRRTFIGDLLDAGVDLATVQQMAGHSSVQTTARYDRRGDRAKRRAADLLRISGRADE